MSRRSQVVTSVVSATLASVAGASYYWFFRRPLPQIEGQMVVAGLKAEVEILRDGWGVPHIYAQSEEDLFFAQGFVHAQDRLWQMEFQRRVACGRLSEILGARTLKADRWLRILGFQRVAEEQVKQMDTATRQLLAAYAAGVNARMAAEPLPVEFSILRYSPEAWRLEDSLVWLKMMAWSLSANWEAELLRAKLIERLGPERAAELEPDDTRWARIIPPEVALDQIGLSALEAADPARPFMGPNVMEGVGSNNWVVAGRRSASGRPLLANDMHLAMGIPAVWYENHLSSGTYNLIGVSLPGTPGVIAGHNGQVAWGMTAAIADVQDLYLERLRELPDGTVQYEFNSAWRDALVFEEEIQVKGGESVTERVIITHHGPIINNLAPHLTGEQPLALQWTSNQPTQTIRGVFAIGRVRNCQEFYTALRDIADPALNFVFADTQGNIGYSLVGHIPVRAHGSSAVPVPGWTGGYEWQGVIPFEALPHRLNPAEGYIATANNRIVDRHYPYYIGNDFSMGDRALRIREWLAGNHDLTVEHMRRMQMDLVSPTARVVGGYLSQLTSDDPDLQSAIALFQTWNGELDSASPAAALYQVFMRRAVQYLLRGHLDSLTIWYMGQGPNAVLTFGSVFGHRAWEWLQTVLSQPDSPWFDLGPGITRDEVLRRVLRESITYLQKELGPAVSDWSWGRLHQLHLNHALGATRPLDKIFSRGPFPIGGDNTTIWATGSGNHHLDSTRMISAPFRFVVDLADIEHAWGSLIPGQSGHPASPHYDDQIETWFAGEYHPLLYARTEIEAQTEARLRLLPAANPHLNGH